MATAKRQRGNAFRFTCSPKGMLTAEFWHVQRCIEKPPANTYDQGPSVRSARRARTPADALDLAMLTRSAGVPMALKWRAQYSA
jgi:hypothetical protein